MHFWFARRTTAIRYYSPSRRMLRSVLNFRNTRRWNEPLRRVEKLSVSSESTPGDVNRNPNRPGDHLLSACERSIARTLLIVTFIFGACPCTSRDSASILPFFGVSLVIGGSLSRGSYLLNACDMQERRAVSGPSPSKQREACKTAEKGNVDIVAYSDMLVVGLHVRRIYRMKVEREVGVSNRTLCLWKGTRTKQILSYSYA